MKEYTKPQINFDKLLLFEKIADRCWASRVAYFNDPSEVPVDCGIEAWIEIKKKGGCGKDELEQFLCGVSQYFATAYPANGSKRYQSWYDDNIKNKKGSMPNTKSDWAYTQVS